MTAIVINKITIKRNHRCIPCLIKKQKWNKVYAELAMRHKENDLTTCCCRNTHETNQRHPSLLHLACKYHPPLIIVITLILSERDSIFRMDSLRRHPIHIACEYRASSAVIRFLTMKPKVFENHEITLKRKHMCIPCLIKKQKWNEVYTVLAMRYEEDDLTTCYCRNTYETNQRHPSLLHLACKYHPPLMIIIGLILSERDSILRMDSLRRHPIHIACEYRASSAVIRYIIRQNPDALILRDINGNTPLHLAVNRCQCAHKDIAYFDYNILIPEIKHSIDIIAILCEADPTLVAIRNNAGLTALEIAYVLRLDLTIIHILQTVTCFKEQGFSSQAWLREIERKGFFEATKKSNVIPI